MSNPFEGPRPEPPHQEKEGEQERELTPEEMREKLRDPSFLPSYEALSKHFEKFGGLNRYDDPEWKKWRALAFGKENPIF